jgi:hypothetical protein
LALGFVAILALFEIQLLQLPVHALRVAALTLAPATDDVELMRVELQESLIGGLFGGECGRQGGTAFLLSASVKCSTALFIAFSI